MSEELIPIAAQVGDRTYRIKVEPKNEAVVQRTLQQIQKKLMEFKTNYAGKDMQDYLAMTMLWYATQPPAPAPTPVAAPATTPPDTRSLVEDESLLHELQRLEQLLDAEIKKG
ncbi:MAG: cell division protein ZapA [Sphingomonadales bacterium]|nr:cell division protein ZapA [Sphingomonadales bacterium]